MREGQLDLAKAGADWSLLYRAAGISAIIMAVIVPVQSFIFIAFPPPSTVIGFFALFQRNWFIGLLDRDLLMVLDNILLILIYLGLYVAICRVNPSLMTIGLALSLTGVAAYFASHTSFEML